MQKKNPEAFVMMATRYRSGNGVLQSDTKSLEMYIRAAELELGDTETCQRLGNYYVEGTAVEQDLSKGLVFYEVAAKKGSIEALALYHGKSRNIDESIKHLTVAASAGYQVSMDGLMVAYKDKLLSKEDLTRTLRAFQTAKDLMKSKDRDDIKAMQEQYYADPDR